MLISKMAGDLISMVFWYIKTPFINQSTSPYCLFRSCQVSGWPSRRNKGRHSSGKCLRAANCSHLRQTCPGSLGLGPGAKGQTHIMSGQGSLLPCWLPQQAQELPHSMTALLSNILPTATVRETEAKKKMESVMPKLSALHSRLHHQQQTGAKKFPSPCQGPLQ